MDLQFAKERQLLLGPLAARVAEMVQSLTRQGLENCSVVGDFLFDFGLVYGQSVSMRVELNIHTRRHEILELSYGQ